MINNNDREILIRYRLDQADYAPFISFLKEDVQDMQEDMIDFIERINFYLSTLSE
jgi:hypothetical protein